MRFGDRFPKTNNVRVVMPAAALDAVFDECDRYDADETGGRLIGTYSLNGGRLTIVVSGVIEPGPAARRTGTSFFQDGEFQERVFRSIEQEHPEIEHLGNWHTHHVNGYPQLSGGDVATYTRIVNHDNHNTTFFYALLVTEKRAGRSGPRYVVRHYVLRRGDAKVFEIDPRRVAITKEAVLWPAASRPATVSPSVDETPRTTSALPSLDGRGHDAVVIQDLYGRVRSFSSPSMGLYWRGPIELVDGSDAEVLLLEDASGARLQYSIGLPKARDPLKGVATAVGDRRFASARAALMHAERACNRALFEDALRKSVREV